MHLSCNSRIWHFPIWLHQTKLGLELASWHYHSHVIGQRMWAMQQLHWNKKRTDLLSPLVHHTMNHTPSKDKRRLLVVAFLPQYFHIGT